MGMKLGRRVQPSIRDSCPILLSQATWLRIINPLTPVVHSQKSTLTTNCLAMSYDQLYFKVLNNCKEWDTRLTSYKFQALPPTSWKIKDLVRNLIKVAIWLTYLKFRERFTWRHVLPVQFRMWIKLMGVTSALPSNMLTLKYSITHSRIIKKASNFSRNTT